VDCEAPISSMMTRICVSTRDLVPEFGILGKRIDKLIYIYILDGISLIKRHLTLSKTPLEEILWEAPILES
jgi:hypothetical protein